MTNLDLAVLAFYFLAVGAIGYWCSFRSRDSSKDYFLGGGGIGWMAIGASLFASNISAEHFIGLAGTGAESGLAVGQFEWLACLILILLGWLFAPFYLRTGVFTMPEFLERRYSRSCRVYLSVVSLLAYVFTKVSVSIYAGALVLKTILGWNIWVGAVVLIVATGVYTIFGGLKAVIYTDFLQAGILILGAFLLTGIALDEVGGIRSLMDQVPPGFFSVWHPADHPDFPWTGILFGAPILGIWYWCTDQVIVQRTLAAKNLSDARRATVFAGFLKILPVFVLVLPGLCGRLIFPKIPPNELYAHMVNQLLPSGLKGLVVAALLAALMSSLSSTFNSASTLVVMDFYRVRYPEAAESQLVRAGQIATLVLVIVGLAWLPFVGMMSSQVYIYLQSVQAYISPPIAAVFLAGILSRRVQAVGALSALMFGALLGSLKFGSELLIAMARNHESAAALVSSLEPLGLRALAGFNFLHFAAVLFVISLLILGVFAFVAPPPDAEQLSVFETPSSAAESPAGEGPMGTSSVNNALAVLLVVVVLVLWVIFSPWGIG